MISKFFYYLIVNPVSHLPLRILYVFSDTLFFVLFYVVKYRKKIIRDNLTRSFPQKSIKEIQIIEHQFYRHLSDILIEGVKNLSISEKKLKKRIKVVNPEIMQDLFDKEKSVLLVSGHYNNWEWLIKAQNILFPHQAVGIGQPMTNKFWDKKVNSKRSSLGMRVIHAKNLHEKLNLWSQEKIAILTLSDQSPLDTHKSYWMDFLNQKTPVLFGAELLAHQYNMAVVYFETKKIARGKYTIKLQLITEDPRRCAYGEITEKHTRLLEQTIVNTPAFWMWSHKRWKRAQPKDFDELRKEQERNFKTKMASIY